MSAFSPAVRRVQAARGTTNGRVSATYGRDFALSYDAVMAEAAWPSLSAGLARALAGVSPGSAADIGCGPGRVLAWLRARGYGPLTGVDQSPAMLQHATRRLGGDVRLLRQDIRRLSLPRPVDLITCTFATLNYLVEGTSLAHALSAAARHLRPGGLFVADYIPWLDDRGEPSTHHQIVTAQGRRSRWRIRLDPARGLSETTITFQDPAGGPGVTERHVQRHRRPADMKAALAAAGLQVRRSFALGPGGPSPWRMLVAEQATAPRRDLRHG